MRRSTPRPPSTSSPPRCPTSTTETLAPGESVFGLVYGVPAVGEEPVESVAPSWQGMTEIVVVRNTGKDEGAEPTLLRPTPKWLAALPAEPAALEAALRAAVDDSTRWSDDHLVDAQATWVPEFRRS